MFVSSQIHMLNPNPQYDGIWRWALGRCLSHEGGALIMGPEPLLETPEIPLTFFHVKTQREESCLWTTKWGRTRHPICWSLDLGLPASRTMRNKCLLFKPPSLWYFVIAAQMD